MGALEQLIQNEVDKRLAKSTLISSVPCRVVAVLDNEVYTVELVTSKSRFDLVNYSGSPLSVNESVQVYYRGDTLTSQSGYIGASLTKGGGGSKDVYVIGTKSVGELSNTAKTISEIAVKALEDTTVTLSFNANIYDGTFILKFYINTEQYDYTVKGQSILGAYNNCQVVLPISLTTGEKSIKIKATGNGTIDDIKVFVRGQGITNGTVTVKEKEGYPPLSYTSFDSRLLDWSITGAVGGVGKLGKNYLKQTTRQIPNGSAGTFISGGDGWLDILNGITFTTTADTTRIGMLFHIIGNGSISPTDVGDIMLVEGSTIPSSYDAETNLFTKSVMQGVYQTTNDTFVAGTQLLYAGDDGKGGTHNYSSTAEFIQTRCKICSQEVEPNTTYSVRVFNSSYNDLEGALYLLSEPGTITPQFMALSGQKSIPDNSTFVTNDEQWIELEYSDYRTIQYRPAIPVDSRPMTYDYCESFADLKAGTYKLMIDIWGNTLMSDNITIGFQDYKGCVDDNWDGEQSDINEFFALIKEDNTFVIQKTNILESGISKKSKDPPYPNYYHREFTFTLYDDTKVGVFHKAYYTSTTYAYPPFFRFYIVDADEEAEAFATTNAYPTNMSGYSAWEPYQTVVSIGVKFTNVIANTSTTLTKTVPNLLYSGDFVDFTEDLPTYSGDDYGIVIVEVLDKDQEDPTIMPTIDINYH